MAEHNAYKSPQTEQVEREILGKVVTDVCLMEVDGALYFVVEAQDILVGMEIGGGKVFMGTNATSTPKFLN